MTILTLVPCDHFWLEMKRENEKVIALCKWPKCRERGEFTFKEWAIIVFESRGQNKVVVL